MTQAITSLFDLFEQIPDEQAAIDYFRSIHWKHGAYCPHCGSTRVNHFKDNRTHKCGACRKKFSIKVGTIFADSKIPMRKWIAAVWMITNYPKGVASTQLAKNLKVTQKTAWFMLHRLRHAARTNSFNKPLEGTIEIDEHYHGGKEKNKHKSKRAGAGKTKKEHGGAAAGKTVLFGMIERGGAARIRVVPNLKGSTVGPIVMQNVKPGSMVMSDEATGFGGLYANYRRAVVNHGREEYVRGNVHTNSIEGFWSLFKRQVNGTHHHLSPKHLQKYLDEMCYRFSRREASDGERVLNFLGRTHGRLTYKTLIA